MADKRRMISDGSRTTNSTRSCVEYKEELFNLRFQSATGQLESHGRLRAVRHDIARIYTVLRERELGITAVTEEDGAASSDEETVTRPRKPRQRPSLRGPRGYRKTREGLVVSDKMDKTVVVAVEDRFKHAKYGKVVRRTSRSRLTTRTTRPASATAFCSWRPSPDRPPSAGAWWRSSKRPSKQFLGPAKLEEDRRRT